MEGWDILNLRFKHVAMELSSKLDMEKIDKLDQLKEALIDIKANLEQNIQITLKQSKLKKVMREIDILEEAEREGARIRSKQEKLKFDDRPTAYFFETEKEMKLQKEIDTLLKIDNEKS